MADASQQSTAHRWRFFRAGGVDQLRIDTGRDVAALDTLDQKLWVALACPTRGIEFDERTLDLIDADGDGRIRPPDLLAAARWTTALLRNPDDLQLGRASLPLTAVDDGTPEGQQVVAAARTILRMLGKETTAEISLADTGDVTRIYDGTAFNGDGIIPVDAAEDEATRAALADILACVGAETDRSGRPGVSQPLVDRFFAEAAAYADWRAEAEADPASLALRDDTEAAATLLRSLRGKIDDFFLRCRLAAFDPDAAAALDPPRAAYEALAAQALAADRADIAALPLALINAERRLPLGERFNPAWAAPLARFRRTVVTPLLGDRDPLDEPGWAEITAHFARYEDWLARKPAAAAEKLGYDRIKTLLDPALKSRIDALIARDLALAPEMNAISQVEKLIRFQRDLLPLLNNIVSFRNFYTRQGKAVFQAGTLYLDGRSCDLCVRVADETKHAALATLSRLYLVYCRCTRASGSETMIVAAAVTAGHSDNLMVGRNGVFYDRKGRDWDATVTKVVENPISLRQAFWMPYRQFGRMVGEQVEKLSAAHDKALQDQMTKGVGATAGGVAATVAPAPGAAPAPTPKEQAFDVARFAGIFAAIGLAIGAIGTALASVVTGMMQLAWWQLPLAILGILLVISGPSLLIAAVKLHNRNLGPVLDACGWAINTRLRINIPFGRALTALAQLPPGSERSLSDPYAEKQRPWAAYIALLALLIVLVLLWRFGVFAAWLR